MNANAVQVSSNFKKMAIKAVFAIVFFIIVYVLLVAFAIALLSLCALVAWGLIGGNPSLITLFLGAGILSLGLLVFVFLIKFLFSTNKIDRSHLIELRREKEPELFAFIEAIVQEVDTDFPKKIYLSSDVNACVFYNSSFWSMFFPIRKNLQIGLGLMNGITVDEFRGILAHEFGHFSQKSMKLGSYVYNVNQVIHNMLYENQFYEDLGIKWANISSFFSFFVQIAFRIVAGIQWILIKVYSLVNRVYMGLSREMEFHADEIAAQVAGSQPLVSSLLRTDLIAHGYNSVLNYYQNKYEEAIVTANIYPQQKFIVDFAAKVNHLEMKGHFPQVELNHLNRYNKSKLNVENQWASHPKVEDRIAALNKLNIAPKQNNDNPATSLFSNPQAIEKSVTEHLFSFVKYEKKTTTIDLGAFVKEQQDDYDKNAFDPMFNHYYDDKNHSIIALEDLTASPSISSVEELFSDEMMDLIYTGISMGNDIGALYQIKQREVKLKTFDYDGVKYHFLACRSLIPKLKNVLLHIEQKIVENDRKILSYFLKLAQEKGEEEQFTKLYQDMIDLYKDEERKATPFVQIYESAEFMHQVIPFDVIKQEIAKLKQVEAQFKVQLREVLDSAIYQEVITTAYREYLTDYYKKDLTYFRNDAYLEEELEILFNSLNIYKQVMDDTFFGVKRDWLAFMAALEKK